MKISTSLLVACLVVTGMAVPTHAEITKNASPIQASTRMKNLEAVLRESGLCEGYPLVVKVLPDNIGLIATYVDRQLSDKEIKLLALHMAKLIAGDVNKITEVKVRLYDPASIKYWKDIVLSKTQIDSAGNSPPEQEAALSSIKIVNNFGLMDGPSLESRAELYKQILKLKHAGVEVEPLLSKLAEIETAVKDKKNINTQLAELTTSVMESEPTVKPISSNMKSGYIQNQLQQSMKKANADEDAAMQAIHEAEQEKANLALPEMADLDAEQRYQNEYKSLQDRIEAGLKALNEARHDREVDYAQLTRTK